MENTIISQLMVIVFLIIDLGMDIHQTLKILLRLLVCWVKEKIFSVNPLTSLKWYLCNRQVEINKKSQEKIHKFETLTMEFDQSRPISEPDFGKRNIDIEYTSRQEGRPLSSETFFARARIPRTISLEGEIF